MRRTVRTAALCTLLAAIVAGLWAEHALSRIADRARSLPSRWRRPEGRHTRPAPPHPRPYMPGLGHLDVWPAAFPDSMPHRPAETVIDFAVMAPMDRPFVDCPREGKWVA